MINSVILIGRVGQDPEMKYFESGKVKTKFSIAVNRWNNSAKKEMADWFNIELWDKQAETAGEYVKKGSLIAIDGRFDINKYTDKEGNKKEFVLIIANSFKLIGGKKDNA